MGVHILGPYLPPCILALAYFLYKLHQRRRKHEVTFPLILIYPHNRTNSEFIGRDPIWQPTRLPAVYKAIPCQMATRN